MVNQSHKLSGPFLIELKNKFREIAGSDNKIDRLEFKNSLVIENEKIILLDFTGWACANCRRMEENVWSKPAIFNLLDNNFVIISLYVDDRTKLSIEEEFKFLNNSGSINTFPPHLITIFSFLYLVKYFGTLLMSGAD